MDFWHWHSGSGLVKGDEVVLNTQNGVGIYEKERPTHWQDGKLTVSTHNIFFQTLTGDSHILRLPLETVFSSGRDIYSKGRFGFSHAKIIVPLPGEDVYVKFSFRNGGMEEFFKALQRSIEEKKWLQKTRRLQSTEVSCSLPRENQRMPHSPVSYKVTTFVSPTVSSAVRNTTEQKEKSNCKQAPPVLSVTDKAGIAGLMRAAAETAELRESLRDIDDVMNKASSLVASIRYLREKQNGGKKAPDEDEVEIQSIEATLGLGAMVRAPSSSSNVISSHARFHQELALELHSWMTHEKNKHVFGAMPLVPLIELFSLYNKARGESDLISPFDVLSACRVMNKQAYSHYTLKKLSSGRIALQHKNPALVLDLLVQVLGPRLYNPNGDEGSKNGKVENTNTTTKFPTSDTALGSINDVQFAALLQVARSVAEDLLNELEMERFLCRSGGEMGYVVFHWNIFAF